MTSDGNILRLPYFLFLIFSSLYRSSFVHLSIILWLILKKKNLDILAVSQIARKNFFKPCILELS